MADPRWPATWAPYMTWAKHHPKARYDLTGSNLLPCTIDELRGARETMELYGRNDDGWPPLVEAIATRYGVDVDRIATAPGASGANFMALAALLRPGDTVLAEWPGYDPHIGAAGFLGAEVITFDRGWSDRFALTSENVDAALTDDTRVIVLTNLHNPSGAYAEPEALRAVGDLARQVGSKVLVDEVYLDALGDIDKSPAATRDDVFVSTNSLTKSYGLAGLRIGWILADPETVERALRVRDVIDAVGSIPSETLGALAFHHLDALLDRARSVLGPGARILGDFVESRRELEWVEPVGGAKVIAVGLNYRSHIGNAEPAAEPGLFPKYPTSLIGHEQDIITPQGASPLHFEGELVLVIGKTCSKVSEADALDCVFAVTAGNDVSERRWQATDLQWLRAKGSDTFGPVGPSMVVGLDPDDLLVQTRVNGEVMQSERTSDLIFDVPTMISYISQYFTLKAGDMIFTGTPGSTRGMSPGDVVEIEVEGVGVLRNTVR